MLFLPKNKKEIRKLKRLLATHHVNSIKNILDDIDLEKEENPEFAEFLIEYLHPQFEELYSLLNKIVIKDSSNEED